MAVFKEKFRQVTDYGAEYFEGDPQAMVREIHNITAEEKECSRVWCCSVDEKIKILEDSTRRLWEDNDKLYAQLREMKEENAKLQNGNERILLLEHRLEQLTLMNIKLQHKLNLTDNVGIISIPTEPIPTKLVSNALPEHEKTFEGFIDYLRLSKPEWCTKGPLLTSVELADKYREYSGISINFSVLGKKIKKDYPHIRSGRKFDMSKIFKN